MTDSNSKIRNINIQLNPSKKRERKVIELLERIKSEDGISFRETIIAALERDEGTLLKEIRELKQIILLMSDKKTIAVTEKLTGISKINPVDNDISKDDIEF